ncbi:CMRF35-like molecule 4 [Astyanax mexicanus]|uniref:CMRF35-like molecule 4 n=1 Tax=Astyanax mexicanus TaxID=7994 RepID=A0A8T2KY30_ASTMX|nr:CMRF35-like molecule 4 [Astyanax mexicanus]
MFCFTAGISDVPPVIGHRGRSVEIRCPYDSGYETYMKYLCRGECSILIWETKDIPVESGSTAKDQRFSLKDDTAARVFTVTITDLRSEDEGQYWCVIQRSLPQRDVYTEILLLVKLEFFIIKLFLIPGAALLFVVVSLLVLGIALGLLVFFCKRRKNRVDYENDPSRNQTSMPMTPVYQSLNPQTNQSDSVYQTINPSINQSDSVYQSLNPNTNQSDSVYQTLNPSINQSDSVHQSLNPNTNQSNSVDQTLNHNTNQSDSISQGLNPNTNQSDSISQGLNPNTNQSD